MGLVPEPASQARNGPTRRRLVLGAATSLGVSGGLAAVAIRTPRRSQRAANVAIDTYPEVVPDKGVDTGVAFGGAIRKLIAAGALDPNKFRALQDYGLPAWVERLLAAPSQEPIVFTRERAPYLVNLLWPIGLSNRAAFNGKSPIGNLRLPSYASTGGWTLGRAPNGYVYFNTVNAVPLTPRQAALAHEIAANTFRPCCDNSTFFQDCNHGSALLGLIELAASQGIDAQRIYRIALTANSYWFPAEYAKTALYYRYFGSIPWRDAPARRILGAAYSSLGGWRRHVEAPLRRARLRLPPEPGARQAACGV
ncbi:MAG TPA: hypothetical protein VGR91_14750 [Stellaceae bacterium]|nr:hypothetical protein [Stellaceae bacterium]